MSLVNLLQRQVETRASSACHNRNRNLPVDLGVSCFETIPDGVEFIKKHYLLDSKYSDYSVGVARITWNHDTRLWELRVPNEQSTQELLKWILYPYLSSSSDLTALIREVEKDPKDYFW
ncbi:hypothetical protein JCM19233_2826 [Vibrio astriarenae]|uniref:DUF3024 domain-containing protein n=1 Tax=Vibrio astriarenae TaxID=1481923 RepID=A0A7Z2YG11_9VIBR|nr:DUF3024 domain-containing protein [Vibrio astriarenae]QIA66001.1 DUF3024 domain-containing protein [Vibrio astriarenae]GAL11836.1 hypothetical protein JCM19233_2826 [Vibrio sp. C7]